MSLSVTDASSSSSNNREATEMSAGGPPAGKALPLPVPPQAAAQKIALQKPLVKVDVCGKMTKMFQVEPTSTFADFAARIAESIVQQDPTAAEGRLFMPNPPDEPQGQPPHSQQNTKHKDAQVHTPTQWECGRHNSNGRGASVARAV